MDTATFSTSFSFFFNCFFYPFVFCLIFCMVKARSFQLKLSVICGLGTMILAGLIIGVLSYQAGEYVLKEGFNWWSLLFGSSAHTILNETF